MDGATKQLGPKPGARWRRLAALGARLGEKPAVVHYGLAAVAYVALLLTSSLLIPRLTGYRLDPSALVILLLIASSWYLGRGPGLLVAGLFEATLIYASPRPLTSVLITFNRLVLFTSVVLFASWRRSAERERDRLLERERAARAEAEAASRLKDEFLATVSHELRTPLTSILGWAAMIRRGDVGDETARHALEVIERNARAQAGIVDDILDVSRVITGKFRIETRPLDLGAVVRGVVNALRPAAEAKGIAVAVSLDEACGPVTGDPDRLRQVVWNLLSNALKFTPEGGRVEVELERSGSHVQLRIADTGIGISEEFLPHVFERFRQADSSATRRHGGLGLGLSIVRHLVELHGGTVTAESEGSGRGATFTVRLPAPDSLALPAGEVATQLGGDVVSIESADGAPDLSGLRVLVVDDEPDTLEVLCSALSRRGAVVRAASSSGEALAALSVWTPDVLISDLAMPGEDGFTLIARVRALELGRGGRIPAAALTAYVREEDRLRAIAAGFQAHIPKPIDPSALAEAVARLSKRE